MPSGCPSAVGSQILRMAGQKCREHRARDLRASCGASRSSQKLLRSVPPPRRFPRPDRRTHPTPWIPDPCGRRVAKPVVVESLVWNFTPHSTPSGTSERAIVGGTIGSLPKWSEIDRCEGFWPYESATGQIPEFLPPGGSLEAPVSYTHLTLPTKRIV